MKFIQRGFVLALIFSKFNALAQTDTHFLTKIEASLDSQATASPTEKVYLHLDRPSYGIGDTIWFKAYVVSGPAHAPSDISGVLHVELISTKDSVLKRINLPVDAGLAWGDFSLLNAYPQGVYRIRAYTNWMRNYKYAAFYDQKIRVGKQPLIKTASSQKVNADVQFFPEGGQLINGLRSKVAVKAVNKSGLGEDISGIIIDNDGQAVATFSTQHLGMGVFALTPQKGKSYKAQISNNDNAFFTVDLPVAKDEGFALTVNNRSVDSVIIKVNASAETFKAKQHANYYIVGQSAGKIYYTTTFKLDDPTYLIRIRKKNFPSGITQFTLFANDNEPLNERIIFINNDDTLKLKLEIPDPTVTTRQKVAVNLQVKNNSDNPVSGSFSVAVINESRVGVDSDAESTILNNLLLTSDLKGYIEKPNYYFSNVSDQTLADLDVLMLTQGYRSFDWKQFLNNTPIITNYPAEQSLQLEGSIKTPGGKPLPMGKVSLFASRENFYRDTVADANGNFKFRNVEISDTTKVVVQARKQNNGKNVAIYLKQSDFPGLDKSINVSGADALSINNLISRQASPDGSNPDISKDSLKIKEVVIKGKKKAKDSDLNYYGAHETRMVDMKKVHNKVFLSLEEALREIEPETKDNYTTHGISQNNSVNSVVSPDKRGQVVVDGAWRDRYTLSVFYPQEIESVELIFSPASNKPIIVVTTRKYAGTDTTELKQVNIKSIRLNKKPNMSPSANLNGAGNADQVIMGDKLFKNCARLSDCLQGKVFGVSFDADGNPINNRTRKKMSVIINGNILQGDALNSINANDVYSIEVLRGQSFTLVYGTGMSAGALVITTNQGVGNFVTTESPSGLITYSFKGYYKARSFYAPKYDLPNNQSSVPDLRPTIYWNPNIITDQNGKSSFEYSNADTKGTYRIVVEGIDGFGNLGRQVYKYKVE